MSQGNSSEMSQHEVQANNEPVESTTEDQDPASPITQTVLQALDNAEFSWFHVKAIIVAGMGFFTDAYDLFSIGLLTKLIGHIYYDGNMPINVTSAISAVALCGTLLGQIIFGWAGDRFGRKSVYGVTLLIMMGSSICSGLSFGQTRDSIVATLCFFRFLLGVGVGGDYPLSATIMAEYSSKSRRGSFVAAVFAMQGIGILAAAAVTSIVSAGFRDNSIENPTHADYTWRVVLMFAAVPTCLTLYARNRMPETARFTLHVKKDAAKVERDMKQFVGATSASTIKTKKFIFTREFFIKLIGCCTTWFLLDIAYYSQNLFQSDIYKTIGWVPAINVYWPQASMASFQVSTKKICSSAMPFLLYPGTASNYTVVGQANCNPNLHMCTSKAAGCWMTPLDETFLLARAQAIIALASTVPGYWVTVFTIEHLGRWNIQMLGFFFMTLFMGFLAGFYDYFLDHIGGFVAMYALTFFFSNFGPNATTFVIPSEVFPASMRTTCHGIAAAAGKAGAIIGAFGFLYASKDPSNPSDRAAYGNIGIGIRNSLFVLTGVNFAGMVFTLMVPEPKGASLEENSGELEENGSSAMTERSRIPTPAADS